MTQRRITLSFDNGPHPQGTPYVLDVLAAHAVRATFFVVGTQLRKAGARALAERTHAAGHWIGNHSLTHRVPLGVDADPAAPAREIGEMQDAIGELSHRDRLFRPFGGGGNLDHQLLSAGARDYLCTGGYTLVLWNCVPRDWENETGWVDVAVAQCRQSEWPLVVLHDILPRAMRELGRFIDTLHGEGYRFVQDFPPQCVPIQRGTVVQPLDGLVSDPVTA